jgi:signal transduction histidine kinase
MADAAIRVLLIEDDPDDHVLTRGLLVQVYGQRFELDWQSTYAGGLEALARGEHDVCLVDYHLGEHSGLDLIQATAGGRRAPIVMLTGSESAATDTAAMRAGADDFLVKGTIDAALLDRSIRYAVERNRLEQRLRETQKLESLSVLAGGIAHNFNNLLMSILGNASLALSKLPPDSPVREWIEPIEAAGMRAAELARDMLAYSGMSMLVMESLDVRPLIEECGRLVTEGTGAALAIGYDFEAGLPEIEADATHVRQVVMNLLTNAAEALGPTGSIKVRADTRDEIPGSGFRYAHETPNGPFVRIEVEDDGAGMDADTLAHLFDPFFTTKFDGRGLGLASVLGIVHVHGGAIRVTSELGVGTVATVLFPRSAPAQEAMAPSTQWARQDSNLGPTDYESAALTS